MTYGEARYRCNKEVPGVDLSLWDGYLSDRYQAILDRLNWTRITVETTFVTTAPYSTGTVTLTQGSNAVVLVGGTFTSTMTGLVFQASGSCDYYSFTFVDATHGTLDRVFTEADVAGGGYQILQPLYSLPTNARTVQSVRIVGEPPLGRLVKAEIEAFPSVGKPTAWAPAMDANTDPPVQQILLGSTPDGLYSIAVTYVAEAPATGSTSVTLLPWVRPAALIAGACADGYAKIKDAVNSTRQEAKYNAFLADMVRTENANAGPMIFQTDPYFTRHRAKRWCR